MSDIYNTFIEATPRVTCEEMIGLTCLRERISKASVEILTDSVMLEVPTALLPALDVVLLTGIAAVNMDFQ